MTDSRAQSTVPQTYGVPSGPPEDLIEVARIVGAHGVRGWVKLQPFSGDSAVLDSVKTWWVSPPRKTLDQVRNASHALGDPASVLSAGELFAYRVVWSKVHGSTWLACLKGLVDRDQAHALKGASVWVSRREFPKLDNDEYYWVDLIGCEVYSVDSQAPVRGEVSEPVAEEGPQRLSETDSVERDDSTRHLTLAEECRLGVVDSVEESPAHPLLSVQRQKQSADGQWSPDVSVRGKPVHTLIPFVAAHVLSVDLDARRIIVDWPADF